MPAVRGGTMPGEWAQHRATWRRVQGAASGHRGGGQHRMETIRCGAARCRPCEAARCQANGRSVGQRGAMHRAPLRDIVVEGSTVWGDVNTSANHTVWSNTMPTAQCGAARCQAKGRCIGQAIRCGATRCRPCEAERCQANGRSIGQRGAVHGAPHRDIVVEGSTVWGDVNTSANHTVWSNTMPTAQCGAARCRPCKAARCQANGRSIGQRGAVHGAPHRDIVVEGSTVWGDVNTSANHTVWSNTMPTAQRGAARCQAKGRCIGPRDAGRDSTGLCIGHAV